MRKITLSDVGLKFTRKERLSLENGESDGSYLNEPMKVLSVREDGSFLATAHDVDMTNSEDVDFYSVGFEPEWNDGNWAITDDSAALIPVFVGSVDEERETAEFVGFDLDFGGEFDISTFLPNR